MKLLDILKAMQAGKEALEAGKELSDPATWKNRATAINLIVVILGGLLYLASLVTGSTIPIPTELLQTTSEFIFVGVGLFNAYFHLATSKKVGV